LLFHFRFFFFFFSICLFFPQAFGFDLIENVVVQIKSASNGANQVNILCNYFLRFNQFIQLFNPIIQNQLDNMEMSSNYS